MDYTIFNYYWKHHYNLYKFYKGVFGGLVLKFEVFASSLKEAKESAILNRIGDYDFIFEEKLIEEG